ncbi:MAG: carbonic anhydrase [Nitrospirae bacterium]|nr:carbonic anhydrase [Nitrospirota bacterium]
MRKRLKFLGVFLIVAIFAAASLTGAEDADQALKKLMDGNKRYVSGTFLQRDLSDAKRKELAKGQKPSAIVVTCSDSRVSPELLFDQSIGDVFVVRTAGNVVDKIALGSIEYAAEHLHSPLVYVLGHEKCGAVQATLDTIEAKGKPEGNIGAILEKVMPAAVAANKKGGSKDEILEYAVKENVKNTSKEIMEKSSIIQHLSHENKVKIAGGEYSLQTGKVEAIELTAEKASHGGHEKKGH